MTRTSRGRVSDGCFLESRQDIIVRTAQLTGAAGDLCKCKVMHIQEIATLSESVMWKHSTQLHNMMQCLTHTRCHSLSE